MRRHKGWKLCGDRDCNFLCVALKVGLCDDMRVTFFDIYELISILYKKIIIGGCNMLVSQITCNFMYWLIAWIT